MSLSSIINSVFKPEAWCCAIRFNDGTNKCILNDQETPFIVMNDTKRYWTADPFLIENGNRVYLFFEAFDRLQKKGLLGYREVTNGNIGDIKIIYQSKGHLSFPFIYNEDGVYYIIPESNKQNELFRLKCTSFPDKWEKETVLIKDNIVDTVLFVKDNVKYYITEKVDSSNYFDRVDLFYEENGALLECENNPVKRDIDNARGAGKIFKFDGKLIRPAQNCGNSYGEKLNFNEVVNITKHSFEEKPLCDISVKSIALNKSNVYTGIHTYNKVANVEVIDLKLPRKFNFYNFIGSFVKLFKKIF
jgi:hypothetical protein